MLPVAFLIGCILLALLAIFVCLVYPRVNYSWLPIIARLIIFSFPFEYIPTLESPFGTLRMSQILVLLGFLFIIILLFKRDRSLLAKKIPPFSLAYLGFFVFSIPSWFYFVNFNRFLITLIATVLTFSAFLFIYIFAENTKNRIKDLCLAMVLASIFGIYQFAGEMANFPHWLTGIRSRYVKEIFLVPRVHSTAFEPMYFSAMLQVPIIYTTLLVLTSTMKPKKPEMNLATSKNNFENKTPASKIESSLNIKYLTAKIKNFDWKNLFAKMIKSFGTQAFPPLYLLLYLTVFLMTFSKGGYFALFVSGLLALIFFSKKFIRLFSNYTAQTYKIIGFVFTILIFVLILVGIVKQAAVMKIYNNFAQTLTQTSGTVLERQTLIEVAGILFDEHIFTGIGSGQFGIWAINLGFDNKNTMLVLQNVYYEVWLEFGLISFLFFLFFLLYPIIKGLSRLAKSSYEEFFSTQNLTTTALIFGIICNLIQWIFFSPVYIMPIFILYGMLASLNRQSE